MKPPGLEVVVGVPGVSMLSGKSWALVALWLPLVLGPGGKRTLQQGLLISSRRKQKGASQKRDLEEVSSLSAGVSFWS